jgi:hypothetical protein
MQNKYFEYNWVDNKLFIKNISGRKISAKIIVFGISYQCIIWNEITFEEDRYFFFNSMINEFSRRDLENKLTLRVYEGDDLLVDDYINTKTEKAYILLSNDKFEGITEQLIRGLEKYSKYPIYHYCINYESKINAKNLTNIRFDVDTETDQHYMQFMKAPVFLDSLKRGIKHGVFLDSDVQVRQGIDKLFDIPFISSGPILQKQRWEYMTVHNKYIPGPLVQQLLELKGDGFQLYPNGITFLVIFNQSHLALFEQWRAVCFSNEIYEIKKTEFLHDESLLNALMWKFKIQPNLVTVGLNVRNEEDVKYFYYTKNHKNEFLFDMNRVGLGHAFQSWIPFEKEDILFFHCVKDVEVAKNINKIIELNSENNFVNFKTKLLDFYKL